MKPRHAALLSLLLLISAAVMVVWKINRPPQEAAQGAPGESSKPTAETSSNPTHKLAPLGTDNTAATTVPATAPCAAQPARARRA